MRRFSSPIAPWAFQNVFLPIVAILGVALAVIWRYGGFDLMDIVTFDDLSRTVPNTFASVDHPFHATRANLLLETLQDWSFPRWIGNHQGGYPVEFYPLGVAWMDVGLWAILLGTVPIIAVHKLTVILILVLPALGFWLLARGDRLTPWIVVLALVLHVSIPGNWMQGGTTELLMWGLVTNVAGAALAFVSLAALWRWVLSGERAMGIAAAMLIAGACFTNPRSAFAIAVGALAILVIAYQDSASADRAPFLPRLGRLALLALLGGLMAAPILLPLLRYDALYYFLQYQEYANLGAYWDASVEAVTLPIVLLAIGGTITGLLGATGLLQRTAALTLVFYSLLTMFLSERGGLIAQLETPRLMPFQRLLMIYLAVSFIAWLVQNVVRRLGDLTALRSSTSVAVAVLSAVLLVIAWGPASLALVDAPAQSSLVTPIPTTNQAEFVAFQDAIELADQQAPNGTAILVLGNENDTQGWWHEQLWAPTETNHPLFYDDWLWYWQSKHEGPEQRIGNSYRQPAEALDPAYFATHGIGAVVVTQPPLREAANQTGDLSNLATIGEWDIYLVNSPTPIMTNGSSQPVSLSVDDENISATFAEGSGEILIRRNWFPRWSAKVNGESVDIEETGNGYMKINTGSGPVTLELSYGTTKLDWTARVAALLGLLGVVGIGFGLDRRLIGTGRETAVQDS